MRHSLEFIDRFIQAIFLFKLIALSPFKFLLDRNRQMVNKSGVSLVRALLFMTFQCLIMALWVLVFLKHRESIQLLRLTNGCEKRIAPC